MFYERRVRRSNNKGAVLRLRPNLGFDSLSEQLRLVQDPSGVKELHLTNCVVPNEVQVACIIERFPELRTLRCLSCALKPSQLFILILHRLHHLVEVEFSVVLETGAERELRILESLQLPPENASPAPKVRCMYVEVGYDHNFPLVSMIVRSCPKLVDLHVHFVQGNFWKTLLECRDILAERAHVEAFRFTSEQRTSCQHEWMAPLQFTNCAAICANVSRRKSTTPWSCLQLHELADGSRDHWTMPSQLVAVIVAFDDGVTAQYIEAARTRHNWERVHELCLVLLPQEASSDTFYPIAGVACFDSIRLFLSEALENIVELNISAFHFGPGMQLSAVLQGGSLKRLKSLSASPCNFSSTSSMQCLAEGRPRFKELDVRIETTGRLQRCGVCEHFVVCPGEAGQPGSSPSAVFRDRLAILTLANLQVSGCLWYIKSCGKASTVRISGCSWPLNANYDLLIQALASTGAPSCLVLEGQSLEFADMSLRESLFRLPNLEQLFLLSELPLSDEFVDASMGPICDGLLRLMCLHVHYRSVDDGARDVRKSWILDAGSTERRFYVVPNSPCLQFCSTATFIGLAKPMNRSFVPTIRQQ
ncbi:hypothetical protein HPB50_016008 [Hyalomma asiaticum]|uniref:Uncharacterized protein n=1 Tax=Hyalomma asiaticum TaxID=266040 RepID=A0ACB7TE21_HYAAI|nr:hypothetical protein HPB50_016008 [Hyalomma asiaticum]